MIKSAACIHNRHQASQYNRYKSTFYLVFDFAEHDLAGLLSNANVKFNLGEIKKVMHRIITVITIAITIVAR